MTMISLDRNTLLKEVSRKLLASQLSNMPDSKRAQTREHVRELLQREKARNLKTRSALWQNADIYGIDTASL